MTNEEKAKLMKFLFPTEETRKFMCNDFYQELLNIIPASMCINEKHRDPKVREENFLLARDKINNFVLTDKIYNEEIFKYNKVNNFNDYIYRLLEGYVFFLTLVNPRHKLIDMYKDSRSIFYKKTNFAIYL